MRSRTRLLTATLIGVGLLAVCLWMATRVPQPVRADGPWYVAPGGNDGNDCLSPSTPCATINAAIGKASPGDTINIATGLYIGNTGDEVVLAGKSVTLSGGWDTGFSAQSGLSTIDGQQKRRGVTVNDGVTAVIERFVVQNGRRGVENHGTLTLDHSAVRGNSAPRYSCGGVRNTGVLTINKSTVSGNLADRYASGAGICNVFSGRLALNNSTVSGNGGNYYGGGIYNSAILTVSSSTVSGNSADRGGGIYTDDGITAVRNTIIAGNTGSRPDCEGSLSSLGYNLIGLPYGCTITPGPGDLVSATANLGGLVGLPGYHPLLSGSPAIDAGNPSGCIGSTGLLSTDQRGAARAGTCDIGAYEYTSPGVAASISVMSGTRQQARPFGTFAIPLQVAVLDSVGSPIIGATVTLAAPSTGPSGTFADSGTFTTTAATGEDGLATAATLTANGTPGWFTVTAMVNSTAAQADFLIGDGEWYVAPGGSDLNGCLSPSAPCATIHGAIAKAFSGDTVLVGTGVYTDSVSSVVGYEVVELYKSVALSGGWDEGFMVQSGMSTVDAEEAENRRGITVYKGVTATVDRFIVKNANFLGWGGGIDNRGALTITRSILRSNYAYVGSGIHNDCDANLTISSSSISDNSGMGIHSCGTITMSNSAVTANTRSGIHNDRGGILTLSNSTVMSNGRTSQVPAGRGGGIYQYYGASMTLNNSTVSQNTAEEMAGGIYAAYGGIVLRNSIVAGNTASSAPDCFGPVESAGYNIIGVTSGCTFTPTLGDQLDADPKLGQPEGAPAYLPLLEGSPAIDAGNPDGCLGSHGLLTTDQRGLPRFGRCDIGAYEAQPIELSKKMASRSIVTVGDPLAYTIVLTNCGDTDIVDVRITDALPALLTFDGSLASTGGDVGYANGVITWTGWVTAGEMVTITFGATPSQIASFSWITNSAVISGGGQVITRSAVVYVDGEICDLTKHSGSPVLVAGEGGRWDSSDVWAPAVLEEEGAYKMWYTGRDGSSPWKIGLATSVDGSTWTKDIANNPVLSPTQPWEVNGVWAATVLSGSSQYRMWYTGYDSSWVSRIGYATSTNGVSWAKYGGNPVLDVGSPGTWEDEDVRGPTVIKEGSTYHMWYTGYDGMTFRIGHAVSSDGVVWTKDADNPVLDVGPLGDWDWLNVYGPSVAVLNDAYLMWYSGDALPPAWQTGCAVSFDGTDWSRKGMLIPEGGVGTFDANSADYPSVIGDGGAFEVWYSGMDDADTYSIGYATAQTCGASDVNRVYLPVVMGEGGQPSCPADYTDDFSDASSGWPEWEDSNAKFAYTGGQYQIWVKQPSQHWSVTPGAKASDFTAAVSVRRTSGSRGSYGIGFGISEDWNEFYSVVIQGSQYYIIRKYDHGRWRELRALHSAYINTGTAWNRLKVIRRGVDIAFFVNNHHLVTVADSSFTGLRRIGLVAESFADSWLDARFDDFAIYPADCGASAAGVGFEMGRAEVHGGPVPPRPER